jgi:hypothetical protein
MDIDTALWIISAVAVIFVGFGCYATLPDSKASAAECSPENNAACATKEVY